MNQTILNLWQENEILSMINQMQIIPATQVSFKNCAPFTKCITKLMEQQ